MSKSKNSTPAISRAKTLRLVQTALFAAVIVIMAFTPIGYLRTAGLEITFIMVPVVAGAIIAGPAAGAALGGVFGLTSFIQCFGQSPFGAALLQINPIFTFIVCMSRILAGWLIGLIFQAIKRVTKKPYVAVTASALIGPILNTLFFMGSLVLLFGSSEYIQNLMDQLGTHNIVLFAALFVGAQGVVEAAVSFVLGGAISTALLKMQNRKRD